MDSMMRCAVSTGAPRATAAVRDTDFRDGRIGERAGVERGMA